MTAATTVLRLATWLFVLRAQGVIALRAKAATPVDEELRRFDAHMDRVRGLARRTRTQVLRVVGRLLRQRFGSGYVDVASIKPAHVRRFYAQQATLYRTPGGAGSVVGALHSYFRYRASLGDLVHGLNGAVSAPAKWRLATLPKALMPKKSSNWWPRSASRAVRCGAPTRSCAAHWISVCAAARSHGSSSTTSTGRQARSRCAIPRAYVKTRCRCLQPPARQSPCT